jgi:hypothetical protein
MVTVWTHARLEQSLWCMQEALFCCVLRAFCNLASHGTMHKCAGVGASYDQCFEP